MTDSPHLPDPSEIPQAVAKSPKRFSPQLVWIIPIVAVLIGGWLAAKSILERGPTITIMFSTAEGLEAGKTKIKYRDLDIGVVKEVRLSDDRELVIATAELSKDAESFLVEDTRFWIVRPRIAGGQVSGLSTLLSGSYIGVDPGKPDGKKRTHHFKGLDVAPVITIDVPGREFILEAGQLGSLEPGSPVYYRGARVGQVTTAGLDADGKGASFKIFVYSPYDQYVTAATRFWNASGIDLSLDANGVRLRTESLVAILLGGVAFKIHPDAPPAPPSEADAVFHLFASEEQALKNPDTVAETYVLLFDQSIRGLSIGAPVDFRGVIIGEVTRIGLDFDPSTFTADIAVEVRIFPNRLRGRLRNQAMAKYAALSSAERMKLFVDHGLRGQLRSGSLITGQLFVALDIFPNAKKVAFDLSKTPVEIPTIPGGFEELQLSVANILKKLEKVPLDQIGEDARVALVSLDGTLRNAEKLLKRFDAEVAPELSATLVQAQKTLANAAGSLESDSPLQTDLRATLREAARALEAVRELADYLERHPSSVISGKQGDQQ